LYLNFVILIVPSFQKVGVLKALAPTQSEPPFLAVRILTLGAFFVLGTPELRRFQAPVTLTA
jgi:hypothetical protein